MRKKVNVRVDVTLIQKAKVLGINISRLTGRALSETIRTWEYMHIQTATVKPEIQSTEYETNLENRVQNNAGWRVGRNPPSVLSDIHLIGIPAPLAAVPGAYYSFHGVGWHFTLTASLLNASASSSSAGRGIFLRLDPISRPTLRSATLPPRGWSFLRSTRGDP